MKKLLLILLLMPLISVQVSGLDLDNQIKGTVVDQNNYPLTGVNILILGTSKGTTTDVNGDFEIDLSIGDTLLITYVGMNPQKIVYSGESKLNIVLTENTSTLDELVVVGYGTQRKDDLTGSVSVVDIEDLNKRAVGTLDQSLQGQVAGVSVTSNSGSPGGGMTVRIRGIGTLNNSNPLFVVDGMMVDDIDFLNPGDIKTLQVLKDASATAIYGSRGSNGVVIVTTKKGNTKGKIELNSYYGIQNFARSTNVLDGPTWGHLKNEAMVAAGNPAPIDNPSSLNTTNWFNEIRHKNAPISDVNLTFSGAPSEKSTYLLSLSNFSQDGIINKTGFDRLSVRANSSYKVNDWLNIGENLVLAKAKYQSGVEADEWTSMIITAIAKDPASSVKNNDGSYASGIYNDTWNPAAIINYNNETEDQHRALGNFYADISLLPNLVFKPSFSFEYSFNEGDGYKPVYYVSSVQQNAISQLSKRNANSKVIQWSNTLTYSKDIGLHKFSALGGFELTSNKYSYNGISVNNVPSDDINIRNIDNASGSNAANVYGGSSIANQLSGLARVNYSYANKYLFTANFRADASSKFSKKHRWGYFPSFSFGWKLSEEPFFQNIEALSSLKLRLGWGQIGNQGSVDPYQDVTTASTGANYLWGGKLAPGSVFPSTGNKEIKWETSTTTNAGIDYEFWEGKLSGSIDYFVKNTSDMLLSVPVPGQTGIQSPPTQNAGEMKNSGLELALLFQNNIGDINYSIGGNFSKINNEVINIGPEDAFIDGAFFMNSFYVTRTTAGRPMAQYYGFKTNGLFQNQAEIEAQTAQTNVAPGDVRYVDADNDGNLDFHYLGSPLPDYTFAANLSAEYNGFDISALIQGVSGNKVFNGTSFYTRSSTATWNLGSDMLNRWTGEGSTNDARYPRLNASDVNNSRMSDRYLEDGSYVRLKNVQLGYTFNSNISKLLNVQKVRCYVNAQNLYTFTKYSGLDPEIGLRNYNPLDIGVDRGFYPQARTYSLGFKVIF